MMNTPSMIARPGVQHSMVTTALVLDGFKIARTIGVVRVQWSDEKRRGGDD